MSSGYDKLFTRAINAGKKRKYPESLSLLLRLVSLTEDYPQAYLYIGRCCHALGEREQAIRYFRYYLQIYPDSAAGHFFIGRTYIALGYHRRGLSHLYRIYRNNRDYPQIKAFMGLALFKLRRIDQAADFLGRAVEEDPENEKLYTGYLNALYVMGIRRFYREDLDMARQIFKFLEEKGAENILMDLHLGMIEKELGNLQESLRYYNAACEKSPEDPLIRIQRAELLYRCGQTRAALEEWQDIPQMDGFNPAEFDHSTVYRIMAVEHYQNRQYKKAFYFATKTLRLEKNPAMNLLAGESARNLGDYTIALNHFDRVIQKDPRMLEARYGRAMVYWQQEEWRKVIDELEQVRKHNQDDPISRYYITLCLSNLQAPVEEILPRIQEETRLSGPDPYLLTALGREYIRAGYPELASKWFDKAITLKEDHFEAHRELISLQARAGASKALLKSYGRYLDVFPDDRPARREYAHLLFQESQYAPAARELEKLIPHYSQDTGLQRLLACSYRQIKKYRESALIYKNLLKNDPENQTYLRSLIYTLEKNGDRETALTILQKALAFLKPNSTLYLIYGVLHQRQKNYDQALGAFKKAHELSPYDWRALHNIGAVYQARGMADYAGTYFHRAEKARSKSASPGP